jgi:hypothetical protein
LLTYAQAARRARFIKQVTASRRMPPWKPEPGHGEFQGARRLSDAEVRTLARWADTGAREGDPKDLPSLPKFSSGWQLGKPDLVLKMPEPFTVPGDGPDIFQCFVIPTGLKENRAVAAVEFRPGNRSVVHHARFLIDTRGAARALAKASGGSGFRSPAGTPGFPPTGGLGAWAPGFVPRPLPEGVARALPRNSDVVVQIHYHPTGKEEKDQSSLGIYFTRGTPRRRVLQVVLKPLPPPLAIPAGAKRFRVTSSYTMPVDVSILMILPHMHLLGREMKVTAILPDGKKRPLIWIKDWDFNWQNEYHYARPIPLPRGTKVAVEAFYDNSADNPKNPNSPPKLVRGGDTTNDEMCNCALSVIVDRPRDARVLGQDLIRTRQERILLYREWIRLSRELERYDAKER